MESKVLVMDDVATSGGSVLQAIEVVRAAGGVVTDAAVLVDRQEGAAEMLGRARRDSAPRLQRR